MVKLLNTRTMNSFIQLCKDADCIINLDRRAGTVEAKDGDTVVMRGLQKGKGGPWLTTFVSTDRIQWTKS